jgi:hypothetical protein
MSRGLANRACPGFTQVAHSHTILNVGWRKKGGTIRVRAVSTVRRLELELLRLVCLLNLRRQCSLDTLKEDWLHAASWRKQLLIDEGSVEQVLKTFLAVVVTAWSCGNKSSIDHFHAASTIASLNIRLRLRLRLIFFVGGAFGGWGILVSSAFNIFSSLDEFEKLESLLTRVKIQDIGRSRNLSCLRISWGRILRTWRHEIQSYCLPAIRIQGRGKLMVSDEGSSVF